MRRRDLLKTGAGMAALAAVYTAPAGLRAALAQEADRGDEPREDHRAWQHGLDLLRVQGRVLLIWGSAGNPPKPNVGGDWPHDIYSAWLEPKGAGEVAIEPRVLISRPEAQEPPSAAINSAGRILITAEDGEDEINQRAGLYDAQLNPIKPYPYTIRDGGHSGHAAALGERFLVVYGEGWQDGGGFMNRGTGRDIHARILSGDGVPGREINVAGGQRDGWPQVAASDRNWLVVWQRYRGLSLFSAVIEGNGRVRPPRRVADGLPIRYAYDVAYAPGIESYVVMGNRQAQGRGEGFVALLNREGGIETMQGGLPAIASEGRLIVRPGPGARGEVVVAYPQAPRGIALLGLSRGAVRLLKTVEHPHAWDYTGTTGLFLEEGRLLMAATGTRGVRAFVVDAAP